MSLHQSPTSEHSLGPSTVPTGVNIKPRKFEFRDLDSIPQYWFAGNIYITHLENTFSIMIPPGERFFIRSVRSCAERVEDPEFAKLIQAFIQQEGYHTRAHNEFNASFHRFGVDVKREEAYAERVMTRATKILPKKIQLGITVFFEHLTATGAHMLFAEPELAKLMHPEALRFWRWHAAEELEHKAVAFDLLRKVGGGYWTRVFSALVGVAFMALPFARIARRMIRDDPQPISREMRIEAREINRKINAAQLSLLLAYFKPGFHPWKVRDEDYLTDWYASAEAI